MQSGIAMKIWLIGSGGVRNIERKNASTIATRRFSRSTFEERIPNQPSTKRMSGIWNTSPKAMIVFRTIEM